MVANSSSIKRAFFEAVREAHDFILKSYGRVSRKYSIPEQAKATHPFICWSESDLRTLIAYFLMQKIRGIGFIHTEVVLKKADKFKFDGEGKQELWEKAVDRAKEIRGRKRIAGDIDLAITPADSDTIPFILIAEVKYYHYDVRSYGRDPLHEVQQAYTVLKEFKNVGLTKEIAIVIGDHYYHRTKSSKVKELEKFVQKHSSDAIYLKM